MKKTLLPLCFLLTQVLIGQTIDYTYLHLSLELDTNESEVHGSVQLAFKASGKVDSIYLNGVNMEFEKVQLNNAEVKFGSDNKGIWLWLESLLDSNSISIKYTAHPRRGMFFIGWNDETGLSRRQVWTQGQGIDNRHWVPHFDEQTDKVVTDIEVLFDSNYEVVSNGSLVSKTEEGKQTRWHYAMHKPHSSYLMMLAIGKYEVKKTVSKSGVSLWQYYYPDRADDYEWYYRSNEEIFNYLEQKIGVPYPWENYKQVPVQDFQHGAMENTTATIFGDFFLVDEVAFNDRNYTYVNAHELAHQWFGNLITATGSDEHWLHEGFATYYQWLSEKNLYGQNFFDWERYKAAQMVFEASRIDTIPLGNGKAGSARFYQKGAWVLYMMNQRLGDEKFDRVIRNYLKENAFGIVTTESLDKSVKEVTGESLAPFYDNWVKIAGEPILKIESKEAGKGYELICTASYMPFEKLLIPVKLVYRSKKEEKEIVSFLKLNSNGEGVLNVSGSEGKMKLDYWVVNPNMSSLALIEEAKPYAIIKRQYLNSTELLDRHIAITLMDPLQMNEKGAFLVEVVKSDKEFFSVRAEALRQLVEGLYPKTEEPILVALQSNDIQLQKEAIKFVKDPEEWEFLRELSETRNADSIIVEVNEKGSLMEMVRKLRLGNSYELRESAMIAFIKGGEYEWLRSDSWLEAPGIPDNKVAITVLSHRSYIFQDSGAVQQLIDYTSSGYDFLTRINAMQALVALNYFDEQVAENYFDALFSLNRTLSRNAKQSLLAYSSYDGKAAAYKKEVIQKYVESHSNKWDDFQKRLVNRTFGLNLE